MKSVQKTKAALLAIALLILTILGYFSYQLVMQKQLSTGFELALTQDKRVQNVIDQLQTERGLTVARAVGISALEAQWKMQFLQVDSAIHALDNVTISQLPDQQASVMQYLRQLPNELLPLRLAISQGSLSTDKAFSLYSQMIERSLRYFDYGAFNDVNHNGARAKISVLMKQITLLEQNIEDTAQIRTLGIRIGVDKGFSSVETYTNFIGRLEKGAFLTTMIRARSTGEIKRRIDALNDHPASRLFCTETKYIIDEWFLFGSVEKMDISTWFETASQRIDLIALLKGELVQKLDQMTREAHEKEVWRTVVLLLGSVLLWITLLWLLRYIQAQIDGINRLAVENSELLRQQKNNEGYLLHQEKIRTIGTMAASVAHEINNPISGVLANLQYLKMRAEDTEIQEVVDENIQEIVRVSKLVRSLLSFSRNPTTNPSHRCDLHTVIADSLSMMTSQFKLANIHIKVNMGNLQKDAYQVHIDADQLKQILLNLLNNAIHAIKTANPTRKEIVIDHALIADVGQVLLRITDNGTGIPESVKNKIFDPFFTTKSAEEGTGLGLSISTGLIRDAGGVLTIDQTYQQGARFLIYLPLCREPYSH